MTIKSLMASSAVALGLTFMATAALAQPYGKGGNYTMAPAPRPAPQVKCDCPMMKGDAAMREQCMAMMRDGPDKSGVAPH